MIKVKVLFVCSHNSARSQMAEAYLNKFAGDVFKAESAGLEIGGLNPYAVKVMREDGIDISKNTSDSVFEFFKQNRSYLYVISVCDEAKGEKCPVFPGQAIRLHWSFPDPSSFEGSDEEKLNKTRKVRDAVKEKVQEFIKEVKEHNIPISFDS